MSECLIFLRVKIQGNYEFMLDILISRNLMDGKVNNYLEWMKMDGWKDGEVDRMDGRTSRGAVAMRSGLANQKWIWDYVKAHHNT